MKKTMLLVMLCFPLLLFSQKKQFKVGLVLSGGGAKGFAHISILRELEKAGVRIDYIGGTSMGAIIGGLYAAGYTVKQIEQFVLETDFNALLQDKIPREAKSFFDKEHSGKYVLSFPMRGGVIGLPKGVSKGQNILNYLTYLLSPVSGITDFSKLSIPFYCVATDAETGDEVILKKGSLPLAMRASGSVPTLLYPVEKDGKILIDGGIVNNFPVQEMKNSGVDFIIGVDVQGGLADKKKLTSAAKILDQIINYQVYKKLEEKKKKVDLYIHPNVYQYKAASFDKKQAILEEGEKISKKFRPVFDSIARLQTYKKNRIPITLKTNKLRIDRIAISGNSDYTRAYILGTLKLKEGDSLTQKALLKRMDNLTATNNFDQINYRLEKSSREKKLIIKVKENPIKAYLKFGLHYDMLYKSAVLLNYNHKKSLLKNDVFSLDIAIGDNIRYNLDYFVDNGFYWSYGLKSNYVNFKTTMLSNQSKKKNVEVKYRYFSNTLYAQTTFSRKFAFGVGLVHKNIYISENTQKNNFNIVPTFDDSNYINTLFYLKLDTFNKNYFPTKGVYADVNFRGYLWTDRNENRSRFTLNTEAFEPYWQLQAKVALATTFWKKFTFHYVGEIGLTMGDDPSKVFNFRLGGYNQNYVSTFVPFYGYEMAALDQQSFLKSAFGLRYQFLKNQYISFIANYARISDNILKTVDLFKDTKSGYAVGYSFRSFLGPVELKYSYSPETKFHFWLFNLGFWF